MRVILTLAALPAAVMWAAMPNSSPPVKAKVVTPESIREQRQDANTFRRRFEPVADMPATVVTEVHYLVVGQASEEVSTVPGTNSAPQPRSRHRSVSLRTDICARHKMHKVMVGKYRWRCRR